LKKHGRPNKEATECDPVQWTVELIQALLEKREVLKAEFLDSKDKIALARGWVKIVLEIQLKFNVDINMVQVKSKYLSLQKQYQAHNAADKQTGNAPIPKKPLYWEDLVDHFGGRGGLGHDCLLSSQPLQNQKAFTLCEKKWVSYL
jgi:hypothetical protein